MWLKNVRRVEAFLFLYFVAPLAYALLERELRLGMARAGIDSLPLHPERRKCKAPSTERLLDLFAPLARHRLCKQGRIADIFSKCGLVERSGQGMNLIFEASIRQSKQLPDFGGSDQFQFRLTLDGAIQDPAFIRFLERVTAQSAASFSTLDLVVLDHIRRETPVPDELADRIPALLDNGIVERISGARGRRYVLSRRFYQFIGKPGLYTRKRGLDRETNKALLVKHVDESRATGARMETLGQVLPALSRNQLQVLVRELSRSGRIHHHGTTRAARW